MKISSRLDAARHKVLILDDSAFASEIARRARAHDDGLARLRRAAEIGDSRKVRSLVNRCLRSYSSRLVCLVSALKENDGHTADDLKATAHLLNAFADCDEPITAWPMQKSNGKGWRPICSFGLKRRALQILVEDILSALHPQKEFNFLRKGMGVELAADRHAKLIQQNIHWFVIADIENFFRSVQTEALSKILGLPKAVVKNCIAIPADTKIVLREHLPPGITQDAFDGAVRQGIPQGSRTSQTVAGILLGLELMTLCLPDRIIQYGDDIAVGADDKKEALALETALIERIEAHPAGPFRFKHCQVVHVSAGFDFLKYRIRHKPFFNNLRLRPSTPGYKRFERKVEEYFLNHSEEAATKWLKSYFKAWVKSYRRWDWNYLSMTCLKMNIFSAISAARKKKKIGPKTPPAANKC